MFETTNQIIIPSGLLEDGDMETHQKCHHVW